MQASKQDIGNNIRRITIIGSVVNVVLAGIKITGGYLFFSAALIADGVHSFSDLITDIAVLFGLKFWSKAPDKDHPYGHGRIETFVTMFIGAFLGAIAVLMAYRAVIGMVNYQAHSQSWATLGIAAISIVSKEILFRYGKAAGERAHSRALIANAWHHRSDALSSIPVLLAVIISKIFPAIKYLDQIATLFVSAFLVKAAYDIIKGSIEEFMEKRDDLDISPILNDHIKRFPNIKGFHKINIRRVGADRYIDLHMQVNPMLTVKESHRLSGIVKEALMLSPHGIQGVIIHIEPSEQ